MTRAFINGKIFLSSVEDGKISIQVLLFKAPGTNRAMNVGSCSLLEVTQLGETKLMREPLE
jgi:hypothetical protein